MYIVRQTDRQTNRQTDKQTDGWCCSCSIRSIQILLKEVAERASSGFIRCCRGAIWHDTFAGGYLTKLLYINENLWIAYTYGAEIGKVSVPTWIQLILLKEAADRASYGFSRCLWGNLCSVHGPSNRQQYAIYGDRAILGHLCAGLEGRIGRYLWEHGFVGWPGRAGMAFPHAHGPSASWRN